jgi:hypothetical protein
MKIVLQLEEQKIVFALPSLASPVIIGPLAVLGFLNQGETGERQEI